MPHPALFQNLPSHLAERTRILSTSDLNKDASYVLYWMHHAVRGHENPALDTAIWVGNTLGLPVFVYQGLAGKHRYNSDRHHTFIMQGARDAQEELAERGITHLFHLAETPDAKSPLRKLAESAALVVAEDYPAPPFPNWTGGLAASISRPVWTVDTSCVVPMQSIGKRHARAFQFREQTKASFTKRLARPWHDLEPSGAPFSGDPGFDAVDLAAADLPGLCAACEIDHSVGPVAHTPGGSRAGYRRWDDFREHGITSYHKLRNNAVIRPPKGVSRLSPYLHHGHVSPLRIVREAAAYDGPGPEKFLNELLIWRELSFNFCFHTKNPETPKSLPDWASATLSTHVADEREAVYSWERLMRGQTGDTLWDAAQRSLLVHGELHNNVRMTWGKAVLRWTKDPETALKMLIDLNHRFALDASDPNSYGGLLWCLGLFDRPFYPEIPVCGTVRPRSTAAHAKRLDMEKYAAYVGRPAQGARPTVAVIGAGLSGLTAARVLSDHGFDVTVFEKSRGPGGRMATRRQDALSFDHGAQYFTVRDPRFARYVDSWIEDGIVGIWKGEIGVSKAGKLTSKERTVQRFVGIPGMSAIARHLSTDLDIRYRTQITELAIDPKGRHITSKAMNYGPFDIILVTTPPEQAAALIPGASPIREKIDQIRMQPCWAVMAAFDAPLDLTFAGIFTHDSPLSWVARNSSKPGRPAQDSWVLHASPEWSSEHLEDEPETTGRSLLRAFFDATGLVPAEPAFISTHRWRYALAANPLDTGILWDEERVLGVCGDWCRKSRVEGAFLSGMAAAGRILGLSTSADSGTGTGQINLFQR